MATPYPALRDDRPRVRVASESCGLEPLLSPRPQRRCGGDGTLHLVDLRNLVGYPTPHRHVCLETFWACLDVVRRRPGDHVAVGLDRALAAEVAWDLPSGVAIRCGRGASGGRDALIDLCVDTNQVTRSYRRLVVASGDGRFARVAAAAKGFGLDVWVVTGAGGLATRLVQAAWVVCHLDRPAEAVRHEA